MQASNAVEAETDWVMSMSASQIEGQGTSHLQVAQVALEPIV
jgi:hypothetical protein